jgi:uncharacterized protein YaiI (UPF0178 family)
MKLLVDADSCPAAVRSIIQKRAARERIPLHFAANRPIPFDSRYHPLVAKGLFVMEICPAEKDAADDRLTALAHAGDIAVTRDLFLASRLIEKNVHTLDDRGRVFTETDIRNYLSLYEFTTTFIGNAGPLKNIPVYGEKAKKAFADSFDRLIASVSPVKCRK